MSKPGQLMWVVMASQGNGLGEYSGGIVTRGVCAYVDRDAALEHIKSCLAERDIINKRQRERRTSLHVRFPSRFTEDGLPKFQTPRNPTVIPAYVEAFQEVLFAESQDINRWDTQSYKDNQRVDYAVYPVVIASSPKEFDTEKYVMDDILQEAGQDPLITP